MATISSCSPSSSIMLSMSSPSNNISSISNSATSTTTQHHCSLKRALIPLICVLIAFLVNTNVRGLYLEYSARSSSIASGGNLAFNPMVKDAKDLSHGQKSKQHKEIRDHKANPNKHDEDYIRKQVEKLMLDDAMAYEADDDATVDLMTYQEYMDREEDDDCFKSTTNYYRPPNITKSQNVTQPRTRAKKKKNKRTKDHLIPHRLIFTYKTNLFHCYFPNHLFANVQKTIQLYGEFWGIPNKTDVDVYFFDDKECAQAIQEAEPRLLPVFLAEENGAYRGDICRIAALYLYGGYYLDVDIEPIKALDPPKNVDFITAQASNSLFFQAIMASKPGHPLLKHTLETMLDDWYMIPKIAKKFNFTKYDPRWFRGQDYADMRTEHVVQYGFDPKHSIGILMGPATLRIAFDRRRNVTTPWLLDEIENRMLNRYPKWVRETNHWGCNFMVHDSLFQTPYFYSRCVGTPLCPSIGPPPAYTEPFNDDQVDHDIDESLDEEPDADKKSSEVAYQ